MTQKTPDKSKRTTKGHDEAVGAAQAAKELQQLLRDDPLIAFRGILTENQTLRELVNTSNQRNLIMLCFLLSAILAAWLGWAREERYRYFYINQEGDVFETYGFEYPTHTISTVNNFARDIAVQLHTWTYNNQFDVFTDLQSVCRPSVIRQYHQSLLDGGVMAAAERYSQRYEGGLVHSRVDQEWVIDKNGRKGWRVKAVVSERILGTTRPVNRLWDMVIDIEQVPLSENPRGLLCVRIDENYQEQ